MGSRRAGTGAHFAHALIAGATLAGAAAADSFPPFERQWSTPGSTASICVSMGAEVFATAAAESVRAYDIRGFFLRSWARTSSGPISVAADDSSHVYVANAQFVRKHRNTGEQLLIFGGSGSGPGRFTTIGDVATDRQGNVYVVDRGQFAVSVFTSMGVFLRKWSATTLEGIAVDDSGFVYLSNHQTYQVMKYDGFGSLVLAWGGYGTGPGQFDGPRGIAVDSLGNVYVADTNNRRVQKFTRMGEFLAAQPTALPYDVAVGRFSDLYVADFIPESTSSVILKYASDLDPPVLACSPDTTLWGCGSRQVFFSASAYDDHDPDPAVVCVPPSGSVFPVGTTSVTCTATDDAGRTTVCGFDVTVLPDCEAPVLHCPPDTTLTGCGLVLVSFAAVVKDSSDLASLVYSPAPGSPLPFGTTAVAVTATDRAGNSTSCGFDVTVLDDCPPVVCRGDTALSSCGPRAVEFASFVGPTAHIDSFTVAPPPGSVFPIGTTHVSITGQNLSGAPFACGFDVTVVDDCPPVVCRGDTAMASCGPQTVEFEPFAGPTAHIDSFTVSPPPGSLFPLGTTHVSITGQTLSGVPFACGFDVTLIDECPRNEFVRLAEVGLTCPTWGDTAAQFVELVAEGGDDLLNDNLALHITDRQGTPVITVHGLVAPSLHGSPWPQGRRWLVGSSSLATAGPVAPDRATPLSLDPVGGKITLVNQAGVLDEWAYGTLGAVAVPPLGGSLVRTGEGAFAASPVATPENFAGASASGLDCDCPQNSLWAFGDLISTQPTASISGGFAHSGSHGLASYDLRIGRLWASGGSVVYLQGGSGNVRTTDAYRVTSLAPGTPVTLVAKYRFHYSIGAGSFSGAYTRGGITYRDSTRSIQRDVYAGQYESATLDFGLTVSVPAGEPFFIHLRCDAGGQGGNGSAAGQLSFEAPLGVIVESCQGFSSDGSTAITVTLRAIDATPDRVRIAWRADAPGAPATVHRSGPAGGWAPVGAAIDDGSGNLVFEDHDIAPGARYGYCLGSSEPGAPCLAEAWATVPLRPPLAIESLAPNPAAAGATLRFSLAGGAPARVEVLDLAGRAVLVRDLEGLAPGSHALDLLEGRRPAPGLYFVRLREGPRAVTQRLMILR